MSGIDAVISDHFKMFLRDVLYQPFDEIKGRDSLGNKLVILMPVIVESDHFTIIGINAGGGNNRSSEISADIFDDMFRIAFLGFGINIETIFLIGVDGSLNFFEGVADAGMKFIEQGGLKRVTEKNVVKVRLSSPDERGANAAFRNKAMNMRIPLKVSAKGVENTDESWGKKL